MVVVEVVEGAAVVDVVVVVVVLVVVVVGGRVWGLVINSVVGGLVGCVVGTTDDVSCSQEPKINIFSVIKFYLYFEHIYYL